MNFVGILRSELSTIQSRNLSRFFGLWPSISFTGGPGGKCSTKVNLLRIMSGIFLTKFCLSVGFQEKSRFRPNFGLKACAYRRNYGEFVGSYFPPCKEKKFKCEIVKNFFLSILKRHMKFVKHAKRASLFCLFLFLFPGTFSPPKF